MVNAGFGSRLTQKKFISEGNLYRLIVKSKLPNAAEFEEWIFDIVILSIRKNGYVEKVDEKYIANSEKIAEFKKNYKKVK